METIFEHSQNDIYNLNMPVSEEQIKIFRSLFRGREDIYARRWVKGDHSGYMPAYDVDWDKFEKHKAQGGTFKNFKHKKPAPLTDQVIKQHLSGKETIGIYPLLKDNRSLFIAADFDGEQWMRECSVLLEVCKKHDLPAYLERSRSGKGGHVWIFFQESCPAWKSRKILFHLLRETGILSDFDKDAGFDRLFPNQDMHSGSGFGNLIALPLNKTWMAQGNTCFMDPDSEEPFADQWKFLQGIKRVPLARLDQIYSSIKGKQAQLSGVVGEPENELKIIIDNQVWLYKDHLGPELVSFLREKLNFLNSDYLIRKNLGRSTFQTEKYYKLIGEEDEKINIPRGFLEELVRFCKENRITYKVVDKRQKLTTVAFNSNIKLYPFQAEALKTTDKKDFGVIVAPPGSGKTIMGLELIARKKQPALIVVHRKQLFDQWVERIQSFLGIPKKDIGRFSGSEKRSGKQVTVGMIQSLNRSGENYEIPNTFGSIIVDECHHIPAKTFRETITRFHSYYLYGLTATPMRKNNDENLIYVFIGKILSEIKSDFLDDAKTKTIQINIR